MARYPDSPAPQGSSSTPYPFKLQRPLVRGGPAWAQKTRALTRGDLLSVDLTYNALSWAQVKILHAFWSAVGGGLGTFSFADFNGFVYGNSTGPGVPWTNLFVAKGDAVAQAWTLPTFILQCPVVGGYIDSNSAHAGYVAVKVSGTLKPNITLHPDVSGSDGYIRQSSGTDGFDYLHLAAVPAANAIVTIDGTCRRGMRTARFTNDEFPFNLRNPANYASGVVSIMEQVA